MNLKQKNKSYRFGTEKKMAENGKPIEIHPPKMDSVSTIFLCRQFEYFKKLKKKDFFFFAEFLTIF